MARFMQRRKLARLANCSAMSSATSWAYDFRPGDFLDLDVDPPADQVLQLVLQPLDLLPLAADDDARPGRVQDDLHFVAGALDLDLGNAGELVLVLDELAELVVLDQQVGKLLLRGIPAALPADHDAGAKAGRIDFLTHKCLVPCANSRRAGVTACRPTRGCATSAS